MKSLATIYLDHAAATPLDKTVQAAMQPFWQDQFYNPSATYLAARAVNAAVAEARQTVALCVGARPTEIIFTAGGTEADNLAIHGIMQCYPGSNLVVSAIEHEAVLQAAEQYDHKMAPVTPNATIDPVKLSSLIDDQTVLVSVMYANNEVGTIQPINKIAQLIKETRATRTKAGNKLPLYFHTDASQASNYLDIHASRLGVDLMTLNSGKIYGPKQTGALFVKAGIELTPVIRGGGQERGMRSGTENVPGIIGFAEALKQTQAVRKDETTRLSQLQQLFEQSLQKAIPSIVVNSRGSRLPNFVHVTIPKADNERLMMQLDEQGIMCAVGSACQASSEDPSHVLMAMGLSKVQAQSSLRFSMGRSTTKLQIQAVAAALAKLVK